jgi:hypothetical protein
MIEKVVDLTLIEIKPEVPKISTLQTGIGPSDLVKRLDRKFARKPP